MNNPVAELLFVNHMADLLGHIEMVQKNAKTLAIHLATTGNVEFARHLLQKASIHDNSKFAGIEWEYMHRGPDTDIRGLQAAIKQHQQTNDHHPEHWGGLKNMPPVCVAEMVCDWLARSQEMGKSIDEFLGSVAPSRFDFKSAPDQVQQIHKYLKVLLPTKFAPGVGS